MKPEALVQVINAYDCTTVEPYNVLRNDEYFIEKAVHKYINCPITIESNKNSIEASLEICNHFKDMIENNKGFEVLYVDGKPRDEKIVQRVLFMTAAYYCSTNQLDISPESNTGRGYSLPFLSEFRINNTYLFLLFSFIPTIAMIHF